MKFCVIGLGRFGYQVATILAENGVEVLAIDSDEAIIASIRDQVTQAICMRVMDEASLRSVGMEEMDTVIVAMGENFAQSVLVTALLKKRLNIPRVIARANDEMHKDILKLVGADRVILPEKEIGIRLADNLSSPFADIVRLSKKFAITQTTAPHDFVDKTVGELDLYTKYQINCIGVKTDEKITSIGPDYQIKENDKLILSGQNEDLEKITKL